MCRELARRSVPQTFGLGWLPSFDIGVLLTVHEQYRSGEALLGTFHTNMASPASHASETAKALEDDACEDEEEGGDADGRQDGESDGGVHRARATAGRGMVVCAAGRSTWPFERFFGIYSLRRRAAHFRAPTKSRA